MDQAVVKMDQLFQTALSSGRLRADASLVLEQEVIDEEELDTEVEPLPGEEATPDIAAPTPPSLDDVVNSIVPEAEAPADVPLIPPTQPPR
jgi:hypothetical protein